MENVTNIVDNIKSFIKDVEPLLMKKMEEIIPKNSNIKNLYEPMWYHLESGGKRIRPGLCMLVADRLGVDKDKILPFAVSLELIHGFSLIHDDLQDMDILRRGKPSIWVKYGIPNAINIGDGMLVKVYECILCSNLSEGIMKKLLDMITKTCITLVEGQAMDIDFRNRNDVSEKEYMEMVWRKTGALFGLALWGAGFIAGVEKDVQNILMKYGRWLGPAFQIRDDIMDLDKNAKKGREFGADIKEGKRSLMIIHALNNLNEKEKEKLLNILNKPKKKTYEEDIILAVDILKSSGSINYARKKAIELVKMSQDSLKSLNNIQLKKELWALSEYIISRKE